MDNALTDITILLDRSGSMGTLREGVVSGLKEFVGSQKAAPGKATLTCVQFDDQDPNNILINTQDVQVIDPEVFDKYSPRGLTPLLDALGRTIINTGERLKNMPESSRPGKVVFVVQTDGLENASKEYSFSNVKELITQQEEKYSWEFIYLGASLDEIRGAQSLGVDGNKAVRYMANTAGVQKAYGMVSAKVAHFRSSGDSGSLHFSAEDRKDLEE